MSIGKVLTLGMGAAILILGTMFLINILAATDSGVDMTGSDYEDQYDSATETSIVTISFLKFLAPILGVCVLVASFFILKKHL